VIYAWLQRAVRMGTSPGTSPPGGDRLDDGALASLQRATLSLSVLWAVLFVYVVVRSGGVPLWWRLRGDPRSYADFGVSTVSGLTNMLRSGIFCLAIVLGLNGRRALALALGATLVATSMLEMARANTIYLML